MELAKVEIRLGGSLANTVIRNDITPAELSVLRHIHGDESIADIQYTGKNKVEHAYEADRIRAFYNTENTKNVFAHLFPGISPKLPLTFKEVGFNVGPEGAIRAQAVLRTELQSELERKILEASNAGFENPEGPVTIKYEDSAEDYKTAGNDEDK